MLNPTLLSSADELSAQLTSRSRAVPPPVAPLGPLTEPVAAQPRWQFEKYDPTEAGRLRRRMARSLDHPTRPLLVVDAVTTPAADVESLLRRFQSNATLRSTHNLVVLVSPDLHWRRSDVAEMVDSYRREAIEEGIDGSIAWLLTINRPADVALLTDLVEDLQGAVTTQTVFAAAG